MKRKVMVVALLSSMFIFGVCKKKDNGGGGGGNPNPTPGTNDMEAWVTTGDRTSELQKQTATLSFGTTANGYLNVIVDSATSYQTVDGFGYTLTGGSAQLISQMGASERAALLQELFGTGTGQIGVSYLRISIGASDLNPAVFSYDDMPAGQTDVSLANFSLSKDTLDVVPVLKQILAINPNIKILGSPWSPPVWMKDNGNSMGGTLQTQYYNVYAQYFVKYIQAMKAKGITIDAITPQNEPQHGGNNPSMVLSSGQEAELVKAIGAAFQAAGITTRIIVWDHNCDNANYPISILNDPAAKAYVDGSAFHLYSGDVSALSTVHNNHPDKALYFTEQWTGSNGTFNGDLQWHVKNVIIGTMRNWSKNALEWNLASDNTYSIHTPGGCTECKGAITISGSNVTRNVSYYIIAHASKFVPAGSVRISSTLDAPIQNVAFKTPSGKKVLIAMNDSNAAVSFNISYKGKWVTVMLPAGAAGTYIW